MNKFKVATVYKEKIGYALTISSSMTDLTKVYKNAIKEKHIDPVEFMKKQAELIAEKMNEGTDVADAFLVIKVSDGKKLNSKNCIKTIKTGASYPKFETKFAVCVDSIEAEKGHRLSYFDTRHEAMRVAKEWEFYNRFRETHLNCYVIPIKVPVKGSEPLARMKVELGDEYAPAEYVFSLIKKEEE